MRTFRTEKIAAPAVAMQVARIDAPVVKRARVGRVILHGDVLAAQCRHIHSWAAARTALETR